MACVAIGTAVASAAATSIISGLMTKKPQAPKAPEVEPSVAQPDPLQDKARARRKTALSMSRQLSAANAVLTGGDSKLGA